MQPNRRSLWQLTTALAFIVPAMLVGFGLTAAAAASPSPSSPAASPAASPGASPAASASPGQGALPGDPTKGQQLYQQNCTACHGANLEGGVGKRLNPIEGGKTHLDPNFLINTITNGVPGTQMRPKGGADKLSPQDIRDLAAFIIKSNQSGPGALGPVELARSNVFWVSVGIIGMVLITYLLAQYNMRWISRRAASRRNV